jgi:hypothetical protein
LIRPGVGIGPVGVATSERTLQASLGESVVVHTDAYIGEAFCAPGAHVYAGEPDEIEVVWSDSTFATAASVSVAGVGSRWRTESGVRVGTTLAELETLVGAPIEFSGFGWDYGGAAAWSEADGQVILQLNADAASDEVAARDPRYTEILGERIVRSDHPLVQTMTIRVERITVDLAPRSLEYDCPLP